MPPLIRTATYLAIVSLWTGCAAATSGPSPVALVDRPTTTWPEFDEALVEKEALRIVLVGDTGEDSEERDQVLQAIRAEQMDLVAVLGDLVYRRAPRCPSGTLGPEARAILDERIGIPFQLTLKANRQITCDMVAVRCQRLHFLRR